MRAAVAAVLLPLLLHCLCDLWLDHDLFHFHPVACLHPLLFRIS